MISSMISPMIGTMINPMIGANQRCFIELDPVLNSYYIIDTPITFTGDYKQTADVYYSTAKEPTLVGNSANSNSSFTVTPLGAVTWRADTTSTQVGTANGVVPNGKLSTIIVERIGSNGTITVNGVQEFSGAVPTGSSIVNAIGRRNTVYSSGIIANVILDNDGTLTSFALDEKTGTSEDSLQGNNTLTYSGIPEANRLSYTLIGGSYIGEDTAINGDFSNGSTGWVLVGGAAIVDESLHVTARLGLSFFQSALTFNGVYDVTFDILDYTAGEITATAGGVIPVSPPTFDSVGTHTISVDATSSLSNGNLLFEGAVTFTGVIDNVIIQRNLEIA